MKVFGCGEGFECFFDELHVMKEFHQKRKDEESVLLRVCDAARNGEENRSAVRSRVRRDRASVSDQFGHDRSAEQSASFQKDRTLVVAEQLVAGFARLDCRTGTHIVEVRETVEKKERKGNKEKETKT
jgi:hypothetical protein